MNYTHSVTQGEQYGPRPGRRKKKRQPILGGNVDHPFEWKKRTGVGIGQVQCY